jgi:oligopeptide/dipeptide ABC transporter ATP-binding protein
MSAMVEFRDVSYRIGAKEIISHFNLGVEAGETLVLLGRSGSGKTTALKMVNGLVQPTLGTVLVEGKPTTEWDLVRLRRRIGYAIQDVGLFPHFTVARNIGLAPRLEGWEPQRIERRSAELLDMLDLPPNQFLHRYPRELSGGQRQRVGLARALALNPAVIVADEAVSALDVSIRAQVINLLQQLQDELKVSYLFIAHDLAVVRHLSDRVAVMYLGQIVEQAGAADLYGDPRHPYTVSLLSAVPVPDPSVEARRERIVLRGDPPNPASPPTGCRFHTRCWLRNRLGNPERCAVEEPAHQSVSVGHTAACHYVDQVPESVRLSAIGPTSEPAL